MITKRDIPAFTIGRMNTDEKRAVSPTIGERTISTAKRRYTIIVAHSISMVDRE